MGTYVIGSGGDYVSFAAAKAALALPETGGTTYIVTGTVVGNVGFTAADFANGLTVQAQSGEEVDGLLTGAFIDGIVTLGDINASFDNLRIERTDVTQLSTNQALFNSCVIGQTSSSDAITFDDSSRAIYTNCIVIDGADDGLYSAGSAIPTLQLIKCSIVNATRYGAMRCLMTDVFAIGSGTADFLDVAAGSDYLASGDATATTTNSLTGRTTADFVDYAGGNYNVTGALLTAGSDGGSIGAVLTGFVNSDPELDTPEADFSEQFGWVGDIDVGENFSDANAGDTLTFSDDNNFAANDGVTFNSSTGVFTLDGTLAIGVYNVAVTASDGNGGTYPTDSFTVTITEPALSIGTISDTTPEINTQITVDHSNALGTLTTPNFNIASQTGSQAVIDIPDITTFVLAGQTWPTINFNTAVAIPLSDGTNSDEVNLDGIQPPAGTFFGEITSIPANSDYANDTGAVVGMFGYFFDITGVFEINPATGVVMADDDGGSYSYKLYNGEWGTATTNTIAARPQSQVTIDSAATTKTGAQIEVSYPGADLTGFQYRIDGGAWVASTASITLTGLTVETAYTFEVTAVNNGRIGDITSTTITTQDAVDTTPNAFSIATLTGQALSDSVTFEPVIVTGIDPGVDAPVSIEDLTSVGATYSISVDGVQAYSAPTSDPGVVRLNNRVIVHHDTSAAHSTEIQSRLSIGGVLAIASSTTLADTTDPVITLTGGNIGNWPLGTAWADPGYSASDNADGDLTANVVVTGTVDVDAEGLNTLTYTVTDAAGNQAQTTRTVNVVNQTVTRTFSITAQNPVVNAQGTFMNFTFPIWELWTAAPEEGGTVVDSGTNFTVTNGLGSITSTIAQASTTYLFIARSAGNLPTSYIRTEGQLT